MIREQHGLFTMAALICTKNQQVLTTYILNVVFEAFRAVICLHACMHVVVYGPPDVTL
jgi:hypothetical protein